MASHTLDALGEVGGYILVRGSICDACCDLRNAFLWVAVYVLELMRRMQDFQTRSCFSISIDCRACVTTVYARDLSIVLQIVEFTIVEDATKS